MFTYVTIFSLQRHLFFTVKEPTLHAVCYALKGLFKIHVYLHLFPGFVLIYQISKEGGGDVWKNYIIG